LQKSIQDPEAFDEMPLLGKLALGQFFIQHLSMVILPSVK
jgi:hypothetical protein